MNENIKTNINQSITLGKEIVKKAKADPSLSKALLDSLNSVHLSLLSYKSTISLGEKLGFLQEIASSVNFCFIQDDSLPQSNSSSIIVGGNNLVVDFHISVTTPATTSNALSSHIITSKISFATPNNEMGLFLMEIIEKKLSSLLLGNCFEELKGIFQFLQLADCGDPFRTTFITNIDAVIQNGLFSLSSVSLNDFLNEICWGRIGSFDLFGGVFVRIFYYANLESLYSCGLYPSKQSNCLNLTSEACVSQWKSQFYHVDVSWESVENLIITFCPAIAVDVKLLDKFEATSCLFNSGLRLESCQVGNMRQCLGLIEAVKIWLICGEIDSKNQFYINENSISIPLEQSTISIDVATPNSIHVSVDGASNRNASVAAVKSRNWQIIKSFI